MAAFPPFTQANVVSVKEVEGTHDGTTFSSAMSRNYKRVFRVIVNNYTATSYDVSKAAGVPLPFAPYMNDNGAKCDLLALCVKISADLQVPDDRMIWLVTCEYSTEMPEGGPSTCFFGGDTLGAQNNPEQEPWTIQWEPETVTKAFARDMKGKAFTSSANKPFKPAPTFETARAVLVFSRNQLTFGRTDVVNYSFAVNSDVFLQAAPGTAQCMPPTAKLTFRGSLQYWRVTWKIRFGAPDPNNPNVGYETFSPINILDQDTYHIALSGPEVGKPVPILPHGVPLTDPVLLDGNGQQALGTPPVPSFREFFIYKEMPFAAIFASGLGAVTP